MQAEHRASLLSKPSGFFFPRIIKIILCSNSLEKFACRSIKCSTSIFTCNMCYAGKTERLLQMFLADQTGKREDIFNSNKLYSSKATQTNPRSSQQKHLNNVKRRVIEPRLRVNKKLHKTKSLGSGVRNKPKH